MKTRVYRNRKIPASKLREPLNLTDVPCHRTVETTVALGHWQVLFLLHWVWQVRAILICADVSSFIEKNEKYDFQNQLPVALNSALALFVAFSVFLSAPDASFS